ncbi:MAG: NHL repeat-containing protein [bacterium]
MPSHRFCSIDPAWAAGYRGFFNWRTFSFLIITFFVIVTALFPGSYATADGEIVLRNDAVPLSSDLIVGRFGVGKLYFDDPSDLDTDEEENVYILDSGNYRIQVMDEDGDFLKEWGGRGLDDGEFREPVALSLDSDNEFVYILDKERYLVQKFDLDGNFILSFGKRGIRKGRFDDPVDLTIDFQGYIYVLDRDRGAIIKFHSSGAFVDEWGDIGRKRDEFSDPVSLTFSDVRLGSIYVLDIGRKAILKFDRKGDYEETIPLLPEEIADGNPVKIRSDDSGNLFILESKQGKLLKLKGFTYSVFSLVSEKNRMGKPSGLTVDEEGRVYITDLAKNKIVRYRMELE